MNHREAEKSYRAAISARHVQARSLTSREISLVRWARRVVDTLIFVIGEMANTPEAQGAVMRLIMDAYHLIQPELPSNWLHIDLPEEEEM